MQTNLLIDVVKNYKQHGYPVELRNEALQILDERGIKMDQLELTGKLKNVKYDEAMAEYQKYTILSTIALILNILTIFLIKDLSFFTIGLYIVSLIFILLSFSSARTLSIILKDESIDFSFIYILMGMILYFIVYFITRKQIKESINAIR
ncbi:hypothetical protein [Empedobacter sedimenti]|uniref:hypothetical protein n=1 Tax=Empedobacter sedimenti TaxID=3042610 RepID=UPI0024A63937|nr:hypothetical protein [Empedobacter sedimenti]